jgi:hypothetical protein
MCKGVKIEDIADEFLVDPSDIRRAAIEKAFSHEKVGMTGIGHLLTCLGGLATRAISSFLGPLNALPSLSNAQGKTLKNLYEDMFAAFEVRPDSLFEELEFQLGIAWQGIPLLVALGNMSRILTESIDDERSLSEFIRLADDLVFVNDFIRGSLLRLLAMSVVSNHRCSRFAAIRNLSWGFAEAFEGVPSYHGFENGSEPPRETHVEISRDEIVLLRLTFCANPESGDGKSANPGVIVTFHYPEFTANAFAKPYFEAIPPLRETIGLTGCARVEVIRGGRAAPEGLARTQVAAADYFLKLEELTTNVLLEALRAGPSTLYAVNGTMGGLRIVTREVKACAGLMAEAVNPDTLSLIVAEGRAPNASELVASNLQKLIDACEEDVHLMNAERLVSRVMGEKEVRTAIEIVARALGSEAIYAPRAISELTEFQAHFEEHFGATSHNAADRFVEAIRLELFGEARSATVPQRVFLLLASFLLHIRDIRVHNVARNFRVIFDSLVSPTDARSGDITVQRLIEFFGGAGDEEGLLLGPRDDRALIVEEMPRAAVELRKRIVEGEARLRFAVHCPVVSGRPRADGARQFIEELRYEPNFTGSAITAERLDDANVRAIFGRMVDEVTGDVAKIFTEEYGERTLGRQFGFDMEFGTEKAGLEMYYWPKVEESSRGHAERMKRNLETIFRLFPLQSSA